MHENEVYLLVMQEGCCTVLGECPATVDLIPGMIAEAEHITGEILMCQRVEKGSDIYELIRLLYGEPHQVTRVTLAQAWDFATA